MLTSLLSSGLDPSGFDLGEESWVWSLARPPASSSSASTASSTASNARAQ
ncbi:unnamed protein product, partial [Scytosiphon promiscuus]